MKIRVLGMDPSLRHWGLAYGQLDLVTGVLDGLHLSVVEPKEEKSKQVRKNSKDLELAHILADEIFLQAKYAKAIFVEIPVGSQSARAMASYGVCIGVLGALRSAGHHLIEVSATEVKKAFTGDGNATKAQMIQIGLELYPEANWPKHKGKIIASAEHVADAIAAIHAGVRTPVFQNLMKVLKG